MTTQLESDSDNDETTYLYRPLEDYEQYLLDMFFPTPEIMSELLDNFAQMG